jgi:YebC/PmpR family DNA-binding regulatory protein
MSGHSRWSTIKRKKGALDAQRGKIFTKIAREIMVAARQGGSDPDGNPRLRAALLAARAANMPKDNQERAIKKGTGDLEGVTLEEIVYEGRGPSGTAFIVEVMTDNRNRTVAEIRNVLAKAGGEMGSDGSASWMFERRAVFTIPDANVEELVLMEAAIDAGAEDVSTDDGTWVVKGEVSSFGALTAALEKFGPTSGEITWLAKPENTVSLVGDRAQAVATLWAKLDEQDDVQAAYCNADIPDDVMEEYGP